jgi:Carboxypeptidase regulatory-like domain
MSSAVRLLFGLFMASTLFCQVQAQKAGSASVFAGRVLDATGAPVSGVHATAVPKGAASGPVADSGTDGRFSLTLEPGSYTLKVAKDGFLEVSREMVFPPATSGVMTFVCR